MEILNYLAVNATSDTQCTIGNTTITKLFQILKTNKAFSPDKLNPALLKQALSELNLLAVLSVHNYSIFLLQSSAVPNQWKIANITSVWKKKDQQTQRATIDQYPREVSGKKHFSKPKQFSTFDKHINSLSILLPPWWFYCKLIAHWYIHGLLMKAKR